MTKNIYLLSLGCAKNLVDSEILIGGLKQSNLLITTVPEKADTIIINTCGFLDQAREESIDAIIEATELKKTGKLQQLIVMGCLSERYPGQLKKELPEVDRFFGVNDHRQIVSYLTGKPFLKDDPLYWRFLLTPSHYAYLKIAEGCDNGCSFCSIPLMRGKQISRPIDVIITEAERLVDSGVKEFLVIAQDTTSYGWDLPKKTHLGKLMIELDKIGDPLKWIRLHYAHPAHLSQNIIDSLAEMNKFCKYLDMPIQHASDKILSSMRRGLGQAGIRNRITKLRKVIPDIRLRTTVIVGYPGETEKDFNQLCDFIEEIRFDRLGIFTYSEEEGTIAERLRDNVPRKLKNDRKLHLQKLQNSIMLEKNESLINSTMDVLIDEIKENYAIGRTEFDSPDVDNIVKVYGATEIGKFEKVLITDASEFELIGKVIN
ncbi:30S ribosomal protein S12 methylthiotransferase RimO [bacterium]|nr:30S ribosomal protein S12 methylthiotransferase RimO [bacterium]